MANKTKAWMIPVTEEVQDYYSAYELLYQGRYSIQKLLTNNELKYAITEEYSYQVSQDIRPWQYYVDIYDVPEDMSLRYLMCTGYVYRFRSPNSYSSITREPNSLYETDFLLYLADNGKPLGIVEVIPNPGVDSSELPLEPPDPYDKHYSDDITGIEQNTIIQFIVGNPITTGADNDGSLLQLDSKYFFANLEDLRDYFSRHPMELMRSPLMAAVYAGGEENRYDLYRYFRSTGTWENVMQAVRGPKGAPGKHAAVMIPEGSDPDEPGRVNGVTTLPPTYKAWAKIKHVIGYESSSDSEADSDSDDNAFALTFGIPQGIDGIQGKRGHIPTVGNVITNTIFPDQQAVVLIDENVYTSPEVTVSPSVPPISRVDDVEFSTLNFRFDIPRGKRGYSPVISGGTWHTFNDQEEEYDTYYPARGDDGVSPIISNGNWWTAKKTGETANYEPIYQYVDTDVRAYGNNFLIITEPLVAGSNTYSINVFKNAQSRYGEAEVTLDSLVLSVSSDTYNAYGMITELGKDGDGNVTQVVVEYKGTAQGDMAVRMFSAGRRYPAGSLCFYEGTVYRAAVDIAAGSQFNPDQWSELVSTREIPQLEDFQPSDGSGIYLYGYHDTAVMDNAIYRCTVYGFPQFDDCIFQFQPSVYGPVIWWEKQPAAPWKPQYGYSGVDKHDGSVPSFILRESQIYCCLESHVSGEEWDTAESEYWVLVGDWDSGSVYKRGDSVVYGNAPYFCINAPGRQSGFKASNLIWYPEGRITSLSLPESTYDYGTIISYPTRVEGSEDEALYRVIDSYPGLPIWERKQSSVWTEGSSYNIGDFVFHDTSIYKCTNAHVSGVWDQETDFWTLVPEWDINTAYAEGTDVAYTDQFSVFLTPFTCMAAAPAGALPGYNVTLEPVLMPDGTTQVTVNRNSWILGHHYDPGDYVVLYGILFQCLVENVQVSFQMDDGSVAVWAAINGSSVSSTYSAGEGINISDNKISLRAASIAALGGVRVDGNTVTVDRNGMLVIPAGRQYMKPETIWHASRVGSIFYYPELREVSDPGAFSIYKNGTLLQLGVDYDFHPESHSVTFAVSLAVSDKIAVVCGYAAGVEPFAAGYGINASMFVNSRVIAVDEALAPPSISGGEGISYNSGTGEISLQPATLDSLGGVIPDGATIGFDSNGKISAAVAAYSGGAGIVIGGGMVAVNYSPDSLEINSGQLAVNNSALLSGYVTSAELSSGLEGKQDVLAAGPGISLSGGVCSVRVDGTTITAGTDGVLSAIGGSGGGSITVDSELSSSSTNPVQNKVIYDAIGELRSLLSSI